MGGRVAARLHRVPARVVTELTDLRRHAGPARAARAAPHLGRRAPELQLDLPRAALRRRRWRSCSRVSFPGLPDEPAAPDPRRAEGIPLYAVETVRMLLDRGALVQDGPVYRPTGTIEALEVPETLHALIAARLDGLPPGGAAPDPGRGGARQDVHQAGAVGSLAVCRTTELEPLLSSLVRKEVLVVQADPRSPEHGQYGFLQDLLRKVAYETLAKPDRKAQAPRGGRTSRAELGGAGGRRGRRLPLPRRVRGGTRRRATRPRSGRRPASSSRAPGSAQRRSAPTRRRSATSARPRSSRTTTLPKAELHEQAGRMAWRGARTAEASALLESAAAVFGAEGLTRRAARVASVSGRHRLPGGSPARRSRTARDGARDAGDRGAGRDRRRGRRAAGPLSRAQPAVRPRGSATRDRTRAGRGACACPRCSPRRSPASRSSTRIGTVSKRRASCSKGRSSARSTDDLHAAALRAFNNLAVSASSRPTATQEALELTDRALELARRVGDRVWEGIFLGGPISSLVLLGRWDEALARSAAFEEVGGHGIDASLDSHRRPRPMRARRDPSRESVARRMRTRHASERRHPGEIGYLARRGPDPPGGRATPRGARTRPRPSSRSDRSSASRTCTVKLGLVEALEAAFRARRHEPKLEELLVIVETLRPGERPPLLEAHAHRFRGEARPATRAQFKTATSLFRELSLRLLACGHPPRARRIAAWSRAAPARPSRSWPRHARSSSAWRPHRGSSGSTSSLRRRPRCRCELPKLRRRESRRPQVLRRVRRRARGLLLVVRSGATSPARSSAASAAHALAAPR